LFRCNTHITEPNEPSCLRLATPDLLCSYGSVSRSIDSFGKFAAYASAIKGNSCYVHGQPTMFATAGGAGLVNMCELLRAAAALLLSL
jgi:hypothetical protein